MKKDRRNAPEYGRRQAYKDEKETFLIICEGENTEPEYFKSFRLSSARVKTLANTNLGNALKFVQDALKYKSIHSIVDQYWVVFDMDANTPHDFNQAIELAKNEGFGVAYSNQAFEFWYLLHFSYITGKMHRSQYEKKLNSVLRFKYKKDKETARKMYNVLLEKQKNALANAKRLYEHVGNHNSPAIEESSTTVYLLVEALNKFL